MGSKSTITPDNKNIRTIFSIFPSIGFKKRSRLKKINSNSSDSIPNKKVANTSPGSLSRSSLSSSFPTTTKRRLSSGTQSMRKVNRSQAKRVSPGNIISSLQALKGISGRHSPLDTGRVLGTEDNSDSYAVSVTSLIADETSAYKIDITLEDLTGIDKLRDLEGFGNNKALQLDTKHNPAHQEASRIFTEFNFTLLFKLMIHVMFYLFVLYTILKKVLG